MISVVCPIYNEFDYIDKVIDFCANALPADKEVFLVDGGSTDGTIEKIEAHIVKDSRFRLLHNPNKYVPYALNMAIKLAKGDIVVRLDAHSEYDVHYFEEVIKTANDTGADIVGGCMRIAPGSPLQDAIGYATTTVMGVGDSSNHFEGFEGFTDSVYLGAWKRAIFEKTGLFDEQMKRNQDDEFHYRAKSLGMKIYQSKNIKVYYHPRNSFKKLFSQYFQYGLYKPTVLKKVKSEVKLRHLIPSLFCLYLLSLPLFLWLHWYLMLGFGALYFLAACFFALKSRRPVGVMVRIFCVYPTLHAAYGSGFLAGLFK